MSECYGGAYCATHREDSWSGVLTGVGTRTHTSCMTQTSTPAAQTRIDTIARAMGWTRTSDTQGAAVIEYRKATRRISVYYGVNGQVIEASRATGNISRRIEGAAKAEQVAHLMTMTRWTKVA